MTRIRIHAALPVILSPFLWLASVQESAGHEFWIEPYAYRVDSGAPIIGNTKTGQDFKGYRHLYLPQRFTRFELHGPDGVRDVAGIVGDVPALNAETGADGLHVVVYQSTQQTVDFDDWAIFEGYLEDEGLPPLLDRHVARGLDPNAFTEGFIRCAKSLVAVGGTDGQDKAVGMPLELVMSDNPFRTKTPALRLVWMGKALANRQIKILHKTAVESPATRHTVVTDADGAARLPDLGPGQYLLNAVQLIENADPPWLSYWASLTFERP
ncbi:MAG: DUF4198 domain-containing protein [Alphaproteobacteria bacterium]|nr:DUF4198 domain-containing protein [Alphaproteobacteria bacterium]MBO6863556.1 DUF4198 domain-containing protein [Alphaproteobacteria bacterium]